ALDNGSGYYTEKDQTDMNNSFANLKKFSDAGYGIILGEHGVVTPSKVTGSVSQWLYDVFTNCKEYHAVPCLWETGNYFDRTAPQLMYHDIAVLYNTVNSATGDTSMTKDSGGAVFEDTDVEGGIPDYLDSSIWGTTGTLKAYLFYQTATWDYRNAYTPLAKAGSERTWNYVQANGSEITKEVTTVTDVQLTADGEYTISYEGFDVSGANHFNMLGISTNILASKYGGADIKITNVSVKYDGVEVGEGNYTPLVKEDDKYLDFMLINKWNPDVTYPLTELDLSEKLTLPSKSLSITFTIEGLDTVLKDIEDGTFIEPETGLSINDMNATPAPEETVDPTVTTAPTATPAAVKTATPAAATKAAATTSAVKAGDVIEVGNFKYKVVKVSEGTTKGKLSVVGLTTSGKKAKKLNVKATATYENSTYNVSKLGNKAFAKAKAKTIILNKNIKAIPKLCFNNCKNLTTIKFNAKLKSVKKNAFKGCKKKIKIKGKSAKANKKLIKKAYKKVK
ncbi:MAG: leucine-rich repeat domain-containing protein, partial [Lachnospiraceae bacterium]|nr:leucine-rich repeat domain-containing protein [Lachnospiraceae bacterium]